jgi:hypothetical protein
MLCGTGPNTACKGSGFIVLFRCRVHNIHRLTFLGLEYLPLLVGEFDGHGHWRILMVIGESS